MHHDGIRTEIRRTYIEGEGHLVEEVPIGAPLGLNQAVLPSLPDEPQRQLVVTIADVPLELAKRVVEDAGLLVVPPSYLNEAQLEELKIDPPPAVESSAETESGAKKLTVDQAVKLVAAATSFDELNRLTANDSRAKVLAAAESRAAGLKEQGIQ